MTITKDGIWLTDENGNRCSIDYFGSEDLARAALASLKNCRNCINCSDCSDCSGCSRCSDCSDCSRCSRCSDCSDCWNCSDCSDCWNCSDCTNCTNCSDCSGCSYCSRCSGCSDLIQGQGITEKGFAVPVIPDIHQKVAQAVTASETALDMSTWHTCDTTHCRAGWIVELSGDEGKALEKLTSTPFAAMQIAKASGLPISPARFYDTNEAAMKDILAMAEKEKAMEAGQ